MCNREQTGTIHIVHTVPTVRTHHTDHTAHIIQADWVNNPKKLYLRVAEIATLFRCHPQRLREFRLQGGESHQIAIQDYYATAEYLTQINPNSSCYIFAVNTFKKVEEKISAL